MTSTYLFQKCGGFGKVAKAACSLILLLSLFSCFELIRKQHKQFGYSPTFISEAHMVTVRLEPMDRT